MPSITGVEDDVLALDDDLPAMLPSPSKPSFLLQSKTALHGKENDSHAAASPGASKEFVPPSSFYGQKPKKNPDGPL